MAKSGFWLRGSKGKLAGASIAKGADGSTVIREIVTPKNPQTTAQKIQRIIMATVTKAYSLMKAICDHSFEGLSMGAKCMNRFNQLNAAMLRGYVQECINNGMFENEIVDFTVKGSNRLPVNPWVISSGSLPQIPVVLISNDEYAAFTLPANTYQSVIDTYGLKRGDQITIIAAADAANSVFRFSRIILDPTNADGSQAALSEALIVDGSINKPSVRNEVDEGMVLAFDTDKVKFRIGENVSTDGIVALAGVIVSRQENDKWLRSACQLAATQLSAEQISLETALENFGKVQVNTMSDAYLNNAGTGTVLGSGQASSNPSTSAVAAPTISGTTSFTDSTQVTISAATGATIKYTTDGSTPSATNGSTYSAPFTLSATATVKAIAIVDGESSSVASKTFTKSSSGGSGSGGGDDEYGDMG